MQKLKDIREWAMEEFWYCPPILKTKTCQFLMLGRQSQLLDCETKYRYNCPDFFGEGFDEIVTFFMDDRRKQMISYNKLKEYKRVFGWQDVTKYIFPHPELVDTLGYDLWIDQKSVTKEQREQPPQIIIPERVPVRSIMTVPIQEMTCMIWGAPKKSRIFQKQRSRIVKRTSRFQNR
ncbi:hypothetical protein ACQKLP_11005 [Chitinophaga sp. NPDC101104]|uniref:hypothetical protein n=1 Tax=Chitinophaga sp. NPDC101104 TaxID=3390561 RepID=UPI003D0723FF